MAFDLTALTAWTDESTFAFDFWTDALLKGESAQHLRTISGVKGSMKMPSINAEQGVLQASTCASTANGDILYDQVEVIPENIEDFRLFCIKDLEAFYTRTHLDPGQMYEGLQKTEAVIMNLIAESINRGVELTIWQGEKGGATAGLDLVDGFNHRIENAAVATTIVATSFGEITDANAVALIEGLVDAAIADADIASLVHMGGLQLFVGHDVKRHYDKNYRVLFGDNTHADEMGVTMVQGTQVPMIAVGGLTGTDFMHLVIKDSLVMTNDIEGEETNITVGMDEFDKNVYTRSEFKIGFVERALLQGFYHTPIDFTA